MMMQGQNGLSLASSFGNWKQFCVDNTREAEREAKRQELNALRRKQQETTRKALVMMFCKDRERMIRSTFLGWYHKAAELFKERKNQQKMVTMFLGNKEHMVLHDACSGWAQVMKEMKLKWHLARKTMTMMMQ